MMMMKKDHMFPFAEQYHEQRNLERKHKSSLLCFENGYPVEERRITYNYLTSSILPEFSRDDERVKILTMSKTLIIDDIFSKNPTIENNTDDLFNILRVIT